MNSPGAGTSSCDAMFASLPSDHAAIQPRFLHRLTPPLVDLVDREERAPAAVTAAAGTLRVNLEARRRRLREQIVPDLLDRHVRLHVGLGEIGFARERTPMH